MKALISKPIVQFIILGLVLFGIQQLSLKSRENLPIEIDQETVNHIREELINIGVQDSNNALLNQSIENKIKQEILYRFALANHLEENNDLVKAAMIETAEYYILNNASDLKPSKQRLIKFMSEFPQKFSIKERISFRQYFFKDDIIFAQQALFRSKNGLIEGGDTLTNPEVYSAVLFQQIANDFGVNFSDSLKDKNIGWRGIIDSKYGIHVVVVDSLFPARIAKFDEVYGEVLKAYRKQRITQYKDSLINTMKEQIDIVKDFN